MVSDLDALSSRQWGLVTAAQALRCGVSRMQLSRLVAAGHLERLVVGVYRDSGTPSFPLQEICAAWLASDPARTAEERLSDGAAGVVVGGATAAYVHGIGDLQPEPVELHSPVRRQTERTGLRYRRRVLKDRDVTLAGGLPTTSVERTVADLIADRYDLSLVIDALRDAARAGSLDLERLETLLDSSAGRLGHTNGTALLQWLAEQGQIELRPVRTPAELRERWAQQVVTLALPDLEPLRRTMLEQVLNASHVQETIAAVLRSSDLQKILQNAVTMPSPPVLDAMARTVQLRLHDQLRNLTPMQSVASGMVPAPQADGALPAASKNDPAS